MTKQSVTISFLVIMFITLGPFFNLYGQDDSIHSAKNNIIKINLISLPSLFNNLNQQWIGLEYQRILNRRISVSLLTDFGKFEDYTFIKYHDFFDEGQGFSYTQEDVIIQGYHLIPTINYYFISKPEKKGHGVYVSGKIDYYHYFMRKDIYQSATGQTEKYKNSTLRVNVGIGLGAQYIAYERFSLDLNISVFTKIFSHSTTEGLPELYPENSFWRNSNNTSWATINLMLGYSFGSGKKKKAK